MTVDIQTMTREADAWISNVRRQSAQQGVAEYLAFAQALLEDDARVARGEPSAIPIGARAFAESKRLSPERLAKLQDPNYRSEANAREQQKLMARRAAKHRAEELLSNPENVELLARLLDAQREADKTRRYLA
jgi:hypothetical protein